MNNSSNQSANPEIAVPLTRLNLFSGGEFERQQSYSRAVVVGNQVFVSGTTGYDYASCILAEGAEAQMQQLLSNLKKVLAQINASLSDVVRTRIYISDPDQYDAVMRVFADAFRGINPACTTVQAGLFEKEIIVEMDTDVVLNAGA